jgi:hypothetical protein
MQIKLRLHATTNRVYDSYSGVLKHRIKNRPEASLYTFP